MSDTSPVSLSELSVPLRPVEAVTIVRELALRVVQGQIPGVPSLQVVRLCASGAITVEGPVAADGHEVARAAHLLQSLLPGFDAGSKVPGALRLALARALQTLELPPYASLKDFADTLSRFAAADPAHCIRTVVATQLERSAPAQLRGETLKPFAATVRDDDRVITISDIRRARRATGLTLTDIEERTRISAILLCELEWGYLDNWPPSPAVRRDIVNYARAAGLDEQLVVRTVWPLFEESLRSRGSVLVPPRVVVDAVPVEDDEDDDIEITDAENPAGLATIIDQEGCANVAMVHPAVIAEHSRHRSAMVAAFVIPALIAIGLAPAAWERFSRTDFLRFAPHVVKSVPAARQYESGATVDLDRPRPAVDRQAGAASSRAVSDGPTLSPAFASIGTAVFYRPEANSAAAATRSEADARGSILRITSVIEARARNFHAKPSPDGTLIAFDSDRDGERGVYVSGVDGRNVRRVSGEGFAAIPSWSVDGRTLAFVRAEPRDRDVWNLWTVELASGEMHRITSYPDGQLWGASWFPDNRRLAFTRGARLVVVDLAGGIERAYPSPVKAMPMLTPAVSPDGKRIVFQVQRQGTWLLDLQKGTMRKVMADPSAEAYTWSPDGRRVAYYSRSDEKWGVWVMGAPNP
jgi:hypothetical protein